MTRCLRGSQRFVMSGLCGFPPTLASHHPPYLGHGRTSEKARQSAVCSPPMLGARTDCEIASQQSIQRGNRAMWEVTRVTEAQKTKP
uniref:Uncharacterized protein n=1 Tax=Ralstonia syzygii R24 TaxID=907261 RepID=G3A6T0_9RALS|nr:hypothetical protein RALSY_40398 [Ralstonia syzygii R24]